MGVNRKFKPAIPEPARQQSRGYATLLGRITSEKPFRTGQGGPDRLSTREYKAVICL